MILDIWNRLKGYKTYITGFAGIIVAIAGAIHGSISWIEAATTIWAALMAMFIRHGISAQA